MKLGHLNKPRKSLKKKSNLKSRTAMTMIWHRYSNFLDIPSKILQDFRNIHGESLETERLNIPMIREKVVRGVASLGPPVKIGFLLSLNIALIIALIIVGLLC